MPRLARNTTVATNNHVIACRLVVPRDRRLFARHSMSEVRVGGVGADEMPTAIEVGFSHCAALACAGHGKPPSVRPADIRDNPMAVVIGDCVHFVVEYGGKTQNCRVSDIALTNKSAFANKMQSHEQLIAIFEKHFQTMGDRSRIAGGYVSLLGIMLTTESPILKCSCRARLRGPNNHFR